MRQNNNGNDKKNIYTKALKLFICVIIGITLLGCNKTQVERDNSISNGKEEEQKKEYDILDKCELQGESDNCYAIPVEKLENSGKNVSARFFRVDDYLIFVLSKYSDSENSCSTSVFSLSLKTGEIVSEKDIEGDNFYSVQSGDTEFALLDSVDGRINIYNSQLELIRNYEIPGEGEEWFLDKGLCTLYAFSYENDGLTKINLDTMDEEHIMTNARKVCSTDYTLDYLDFMYVDMSTEKIQYGRINLNSGEIKDVSYDDVIFRVDYPMMVKNNISPDNRFIIIDDDNNRAYLYEENGRYISRCSVSENPKAFYGADFVWCEELGGYFYLDIVLDDYIKLFFWDTQVLTTGENFSFEKSEKTSTDAGVSQNTQQRAREISEKYGVEILIGNQCDPEGYMDYIWEQTWDEEGINMWLDYLDECLGVYPENFLSQLCYGSIQVIQIQLVTDLRPVNALEYESGVAAFVDAQADRHYMVIDVTYNNKGTVFHEISHIIDGRLEWDTELRENAIFSEEKWLSLQPEGFDYAYTYGQMDESMYSYTSTGYFVYDYSLRFPTEDRATMMEEAMMNYTVTFELNTHLYDKMDYYSKCIRDAFDTTGWPEVCPWEQILNN